MTTDPLTPEQQVRAAALYSATRALLGEQWTAGDLIEAARYIATGESTPVDDRFLNRGMQ